MNRYFARLAQRSDLAAPLRADPEGAAAPGWREESVEIGAMPVSDGTYSGIEATEAGVASAYVVASTLPPSDAVGLDSIAFAREILRDAVPDPGHEPAAAPPPATHEWPLPAPSRAGAASMPMDAPHAAAPASPTRATIAESAGTASDRAVTRVAPLVPADTASIPTQVRGTEAAIRTSLPAPLRAESVAFAPDSSQPARSRARPAMSPAREPTPALPPTSPRAAHPRSQAQPLPGPAPVPAAATQAAVQVSIGRVELRLHAEVPAPAPPPAPEAPDNPARAEPAATPRFNPHRHYLRGS